MTFPGNDDQLSVLSVAGVMSTLAEAVAAELVRRHPMVSAIARAPTDNTASVSAIEKMPEIIEKVNHTGSGL